MKVIYAIVLILFCVSAQAESSTPNAILDVFIKKNIVGRDSGKEVTKKFLSGCITSQRPNRYKLECNDILSTHDIAYFEDNDKSKIILITEEGASVENRWVFRIQGDKYIDIKNDVWPVITDAEISRMLIKQTGNNKYTPDFVRSVAHSGYRVQHTMSNALKVSSGIPDDTYGMELGVITWNGRKFIFNPKDSE